MIYCAMPSAHRAQSAKQQISTCKKAAGRFVVDESDRKRKYRRGVVRRRYAVWKTGYTWMKYWQFQQPNVNTMPRGDETYPRSRWPAGLLRNNRIVDALSVFRKPLTRNFVVVGTLVGRIDTPDANVRLVAREYGFVVAGNSIIILREVEIGKFNACWQIHHPRRYWQTLRNRLLFHIHRAWGTFTPDRAVYTNQAKTTRVLIFRLVLVRGNGSAKRTMCTWGDQSAPLSAMWSA